MATDSKDLHVLIIGAGITGLLIAQGLKKAGIRFSIFESEPTADFPRPREWSMALHWSMPQLEDLLPQELRERLMEVHVDPSFKRPEKDELKVFDGTSGEIIRRMDLPQGTIRAQRRRMRAFCSVGIDVNYGYELERLDYGTDNPSVTAIFKNSQIVEGTTVIGCDGSHSKVRELLLGKDKASVTPVRLVHCNISTNYPVPEQAKFVRSADPIWCFVFYPEIMLVQTMQDVPDPNEPTTWRFQYIFSWLGEPDQSLSNSERLAQVKSKGALLSEPFRSAFLWLPEDTVIRYNNLGYWIPVPWDTRSGRATLAGDSAHPMPPHRGQGLNHAICDASHFVDAMKKVHFGESTLKEAMTSYSLEIVERGADEVRNSVLTADMVYDWDQLPNSPFMQRAMQKSLARDVPNDE